MLFFMANLIFRCIFCNWGKFVINQQGRRKSGASGAIAPKILGVCTVKPYMAHIWVDFNYLGSQ